MQCHHQNRRTRGELGYLFRGVQSVHAGHLKIEHHDIKFFFIKFRDRVASIGRLLADFPLALGFQDSPPAAPNEDIVIHDQDAGGVGSLLNV